MATNRENQGLQIALILFVIITIMLAVTTFYFFNQAQDSVAKADEAKNAAIAADKRNTENTKEVHALKDMMGYEIEGEISEIKENFENDMIMYGSELPEGEKNYRGLPRALVTEITDLENKLVSALKDYNQGLANTKSELANQRSVVTTTIDKSAKDREGYVASVANLNSAVASQRQNSDVLRKRVDDTQRAALLEKQRGQAAVEGIAKKLEVATKLIDGLEVRIQDNRQKTFEQKQAQGKVTFVTREAVYINLGSADGLQRQTTFSIFDEDITGVSLDKSKASIEITKIMGAHNAEARVVHIDPSQTVLPGDQVFSSIWRPGRTLHFALAGFMDVDNDRRSDRKMISNLILRNKGAIDAQVDDKGVRTGTLNVNTRYLVLGNRPTENATQEYLDAYSQIQKDAKKNGVEILSVDRLLDLMGWQGSRVTGTIPSGSSTGQPSTFSKRRPKQGRSAYQSN